jgi:hypothetical protein
MHAETMGRAIQQTANVSAPGSATLSIGEIGNVGHFGNVQVVADTQFFELKLEELRAEQWLEPAAAQRLIEALLGDRLLILAGPLGDKAECARYLAYRLRQQLEGEAGVKVTVRERWRGKDPQRIEAALEDDGVTILLLTEISKSQVAGYGPTKLHEVLRGRNGYAIVTTDCSREQWDLGEHGFEARVWKELSWESYYGGSHPLARYLERLLVSSELPVPEGVLPDGPGGTFLVAGLPLVAVAERLKSPGRLRFFAEWLLRGQTSLALATIQTKVDELAGDASAIRVWYQQFEPRDQLLAVGLVLLDGLPDDLLFAGLELLVETAWRSTDPLLAQFDYHDLSRFAAYFKETRVNGGFVRIESGSRERRRQILRIAWQHQRRRLLATLPTLTEMIRLSASDPAAPTAAGARTKETRAANPPDKETASVGRAAARALGRTEDGSVQLHQVLVESLSLIGLLSIDVVEPYLLDLAADPSESVQHLVAGALAAWREEGKDKELFELLRRWWAEGCEVGNLDSRIGRVARLGPDPWAAVRTAVAIAVGYAAPHDREDRLAPALRDLLSELLVDLHPRVRGTVVRYTLPRTIAWHFRQLEPILRTRALASPDLVAAVARGAAAACEMRPEVCLPILESWRTTARAETRRGSPRTVTSREAMLAAVARAYGDIRCDEEQPRLSTATITSKLRAILTEEGHPFVRRHAFLAVEVQTQRDFGLAAQLLPAVLARVTLKDRPAVIQLAVRTYLFQRQLLPGGDQRIAVGGRSFAVWTRTVRPLTGLEASLYSWILDDSRPVAQQLAVDIFAALSDTALDRDERMLRQPQPRSAATPAAVATPTAPPAAEIHALPLLGHMAILLAAPRKPQLRQIMKPLLAEVIMEYRRRPPATMQSPRNAPAEVPSPTSSAVSAELTQGTGSSRSNGLRPADPPLTFGHQRIDYLLTRWTGVRNAATNAMAMYLRRALTIYEWRWALVLAMVLLLCITWLVGRRSWEAFAHYRAASAASDAIREAPGTTPASTSPD